MNILSVDTSTPVASIAITTESATIAELSFVCQRALSSRLVQEVDHLLHLSSLSLSDMDLFAVGMGPGSFTGVRCGVAAIQGFAFASSKPAVGFSSLAALAMNLSCSKIPVCAMLDARKNEIYAGLYDLTSGLPKTLVLETVSPAEQFIRQIYEYSDREFLIVGEGSKCYYKQLQDTIGDNARFAPVCLNNVRAVAGATIAYNNFLQYGATELSSILPNYIRPSDAEIARLAKTIP